MKMHIEIEFDADKLIDDVMANYPEHSSPSLRCVGWNYGGCRFEFRDVEVSSVADAKADGCLIELTLVELSDWLAGRPYTNVEYVVTRKELRAGLRSLLHELVEGKLRGLSINVNNFRDPGNWDCDCTDALVQCAIFGEVRYG
jgi:hypothetical protein